MPRWVYRAQYPDEAVERSAPLKMSIKAVVRLTLPPLINVKMSARATTALLSLSSMPTFCSISYTSDIILVFYIQIKRAACQPFVCEKILSIRGP
jgi:hypothetical protein